MLLVCSSGYPNRFTFPWRKDYCYTLRKIAKICKDPVRRNIFDRKNGFDGSTLTCDSILAYNNSEGNSIRLVIA